MNPSIKKNCIIKCNLHALHRSYIILTKQNIFNFRHNVSKKFNVSNHCHFHIPFHHLNILGFVFENVKLKYYRFF